ncbi:inheritance of peroxisomes protein 1-domain-containing protein [Apiospora rasikravindrae]|uniref:Inheritance of peroxisomes protein 1 n=1 Tax=Apiospora rasikravindrae TaxID=990691 RepID=A0ABR1RYH7_9PEZI
MDSQSHADPRMPAPRRVVTLPTVLQVPRRSPSVSSLSSRTSALSSASRGPDELVETLYNHPYAKITSFTSGCVSYGSSNGLDEPEPGSLSPSSRLERTIAIGPFRIYRAPGSVAFLSCGAALQPILPKSQCWCIAEDNSQFVLQIRRPQYWRIEVPVADAEEVQQALHLRDVFDNILLFEKTECPFERSFTVELPPRPETPVIKKPWTSVGKHLIPTVFTADLSPPAPSPRVVSGRMRLKPVPRKTEFSSEDDTHSDEKEIPTPSVTQEDQITTVAESSEPEIENRGRRSEKKEKVAITTNAPVALSVYDKAGKSHAAGEPQIIEVRVDSDSSDQGKETDAQDLALTTLETKRDTEVDMAISQSEVRPSQAEAPEQVQISPDPCVINTRVSDPPASVPDVPLKRQDPKPKARVLQNSKAPRLVSASKILEPTLTMPLEESLLPKRPRQTVTVQECTNEPDAAPASTEEVFGDDDDGPSLWEGSGHVGAVDLKKKRMSRILAGRSAALQPQLTVMTAPPSRPRPSRPAAPSRPARRQPMRTRPAIQIPSPEPPAPSHTSDDTSPIGSTDGSTDSFHSLQSNQSWHSPITPLPASPTRSRAESPSGHRFPYPHDNIYKTPKVRVKDNSEAVTTPRTDVTVMPNSATLTNNSDSPMPRSPSEDSKLASPAYIESVKEEIRASALEERPALRNRARSASHTMSISQRRGLSPLPPAANLFTPPRQARPATALETVRKLPSSIIHKTVSIFMSPPGHLVNLMLQVAAKIAAGEWRGLVFGFNEGGEKIPVQWDYSDGELSSWEDDDDYHFCMGRFGSMRKDKEPEEQQQQSPPRVNDEPVGSPEEDSRGWEVD